jgi:hypothetical protein
LWNEPCIELAFVSLFFLGETGKGNAAETGRREKVSFDCFIYSFVCLTAFVCFFVCLVVEKVNMGNWTGKKPYSFHYLGFGI